MDQKIALERALAKAAEFLGKPIELPAENKEDLIREAQSVINYFDVKGEQFKHIECRQCGYLFAYSYHYDGVKYCSIPCIKRALKERGLTWDPSVPVEQRYGPVAVPAVVPPSALKTLQQVLKDDTQVDQLDNTSHE
jgi:predicted nucleic-acid-binding Zn-ribbon protein